VLDLRQYQIRPVGVVRSPLRSLDDAPRQSFEGAPEAWLAIDAAFAEAIDGIAVGSEIVVLTWLHRADRSVLRVHPRDELERPLAGVFATRSPARPNPIGLHRVRVVELDAQRGIRVDELEAVDGTPIIDIKPVMPESTDA
jgi:tRNA-Thr(GGU) m(6)t(6)A37 methyltransferase TsaA